MVKHDLASVGSQHINGEKKELSCECDAFLGFLRALTGLGRALLPFVLPCLLRARLRHLDVLDFC